MLKYLFKRISLSAVTIFILITASFFLMHAVPGGPFNYEKATPVTKANMEKKYGLDKPLGEQYGIYLKNLAKLDLGTSLQKKGRTVNGIIGEKFPYSARLGLLAIMLSIMVGVPLGALSALKHETLYDRFILLFTNIFISVPGFVLGTLLIVVFGAVLNIAPVTWTDSPSNYILPVITYSLYPICYITKLTRSSMLETLSQDYIKTARSKGLSSFKVNFKHALRNSMIPVITYLGPLTAFLITGGFVVEKIFSVPGLGRFFVESVSGRDYPVIMGTTIFLGFMIIAMNLIVDVIYTFVDPRIKLK